MRDDFQDLMRHSGALGGIMRCMRSECRVQLIGGLMHDLNITPTQTVARHLMTRVFGEAASADVLRKTFAEPGRTAHVKLVGETFHKLYESPSAAALYASEYRIFNNMMKAHVQKMRKQVGMRARLDMRNKRIIHEE